MREISIQDLKAQLSATVAEAESGGTIVITRHNEPVARLSPAHSHHLHRATAVTAEPLKPALRRGTKGRYLEVLIEDRGNR
jgi:prevent-host-death family protein